MPVTQNPSFIYLDHQMALRCCQHLQMRGSFPFQFAFATIIVLTGRHGSICKRCHRQAFLRIGCYDVELYRSVPCVPFGPT